MFFHNKKAQLPQERALEHQHGRSFIALGRLALDNIGWSQIGQLVTFTQRIILLT